MDNNTLVGTEIVLASADKDMTGTVQYLSNAAVTWYSFQEYNKYVLGDRKWPQTMTIDNIHKQYRYVWMYPYLVEGIHTQGLEIMHR